MEDIIFHDPALNAVVLLLCFLMLPFPMLVYSAIRMKLASKKNLIQFGMAFVFLSLLFALLFSGFLGIISDYENQMIECQTNYLYEIQIGNSPAACSDMSPEAKEDLSSFKNLAIILSVFVTVVIVSLGVNLIGAAIAMTHDNLVIKEISEQVSDINESLKSQTKTLYWFLAAVIVLLLVSIAGFLYVSANNFQSI